MWATVTSANTNNDVLNHNFDGNNHTCVLYFTTDCSVEHAHAKASRQSIARLLLPLYMEEWQKVLHGKACWGSLGLELVQHVSQR
jgi:hypothetical protein